jgi:hypothetical protein
MAVAVDTTVWFDTLPPIHPPRFAAEHPSWCTRHWAPAVRLHADGTGASMQLYQMVRRLLGSHDPKPTPAQVRQWQATAGPVCCILGDDLMYAIWAPWLPTKP